MYETCVDTYAYDIICANYMLKMLCDISEVTFRGRGGPVRDPSYPPRALGNTPLTLLRFLRPEWVAVITAPIKNTRAIELAPAVGACLQITVTHQES